jgi:hypothetical protein
VPPVVVTLSVRVEGCGRAGLLARAAAVFVGGFARVATEVLARAIGNRVVGVGAGLPVFILAGVDLEGGEY